MWRRHTNNNKQGREDIKLKVNIQSLIHPYIFYTTVALQCEKDAGMGLCTYIYLYFYILLPCLCSFFGMPSLHLFSDFIFSCQYMYATFSQQITLDTLSGHTLGMGVVVLRDGEHSQHGSAAQLPWGRCMVILHSLSTYSLSFISCFWH